MACPTYLENDIVAVLTISELRQYKFEKPSDSIKIEFKTKKGDKIAKIESGISFTPHRGNMQVDASALVSVIQTQTSLKFTLRPEHKVFASDVPSLHITFPEQTQVVYCQVKEVNSDPQPTSPSCQRSS
jgi:hypothetical protein